MGGKKKEAKEKPLDKMTAKELREVAKDIPGIVGVHSMNKLELLEGIKEARGIVDDGPKKDTGLIRTLKKQINELKEKKGRSHRGQGQGSNDHPSPQDQQAEEKDPQGGLISRFSARLVIFQ